jgi:outer membrane protein assembly factor BamB
MKGEVLWTKPIFKGHSYAVAPNPVLHGEAVYITAGYGGGCHLFEISDGGGKFTATDKYPKTAQKSFKNTHGGVVLVDGHIYGHSEVLGWACQELQSGKIAWNERSIMTCKSGATVAADNRLYLYSDDGAAALLKPNAMKWDEVGTFEIPEKSKLRQQNPNLRAAGIWAHPVVANGRLYLRDQELIFCYDVKAKK